MGLFGRKVRPVFNVGDPVEFRPGYATMASGQVTEDNGDGTYQVVIAWSTTSLFNANSEYRIKPEEIWLKTA